MTIGTLTVNVSAADSAKPIEAALVRIFVDNGECETLITDSSGRTEPLSLETPDSELSLSPYSETDVCTYCIVEVQADKYYSMMYENVQVFGGVESVLEANMEPLTLNDGEGEPQTSGECCDDPVLSTGKPEVPKLITIPLPCTGGGDSGTAPEDSGRILDKVVIPSFITVHLGAPDESAQNVTVPFIDYIKNVCSSEIYPTWPENAIRANMYCQISLALNRIYTEWYRSRGYPFDITNSTSYDQYFVFGRNIFANIGKIADEIFDIYIRREGFGEPFYAEYCNGTTVGCPGLKQWGTVTLAREGYSPLGILQYYYGDDIGLYSADIISGVPSSYPGTALRRGSTGNAVKTVQQQLTAVRSNYPLIPSVGNVDGIFGSATENAVKQFQKIFNLTADGVVGKATWYKLSYIYVSVRRLAQLTSLGTTAPSVPSTPPSSILRYGSRGQDVVLAQYFLDTASIFYEQVGRVDIDGAFGTDTYNSVVSFQNLFGLVPDGVIGPATWAKLYQVFLSVLNSVTSANIPYPGYVLKVGSTGSSVSMVQRYLFVVGSYFRTVPQPTIDGKFGNGTKSSVLAFQRLFGLTADGIVGRSTWNRLVGVYDTLTAYI